MQIVLLGLSQRTAPVSLRERVAFGPDALPLALTALRGHVDEALILSTCNRVELYAVAGHHESGSEVLARFLADARGIDAGALRAHAYALSHEHAVRHLHRVTAGLDSMVTGESEVLTQVRRAAGRARGAGALGPVLARLVASAVTFGRRVRSNTYVGGEAPSVVSLAVREAERAAGSLAGKTVVVLGAGHTAALACARIAARSPARLVIANRTFGHATVLARHHAAEVCVWEDRHRAAAEADVLMACTSSSARALDGATLGALRQRTDAPLVCVDVTVPRTVDPAVGELPGVTLLDFASLEASARHAFPADPEIGMHAERLVEIGVARFMAWWRARAVVPTVARLRERADSVRDAELARALARLPLLSARERRVVTGLARRIVSKLLHEPTMALKKDPEGANMAVVLRRLFALDDGHVGPAIHDIAGHPQETGASPLTHADVPILPLEEPSFR